MFNKGEHVVYGSSGPCLVENVTKLNMPGCDAKRKYYVLQPMNSAGSKIYSPVDNEKVQIRGILSRKEARNLINEADQIEEVDIENDKVRDAIYRDVLRASDPRQYVGMIKTLLHKRSDRAAQGRKFTSVDEKYLREILDMLTIELSLSLGQKLETTTKKLMAKLGEDLD